jgi:MoxR-like ATPase
LTSVDPSPSRPTAGAVDTSADAVVAKEIAAVRDKLMGELSKRIVGQQRVIDLLLISLFARGHCLFIGVPGLAKTLLISTLAEALNLRFNRIQFTPDLMPSDITGTDILEEDHATGRRVFRFIRGPIFSNILLADEINRTPPKTQAALLQAMQERQVTAAGTTYDLTPPFLVFATQNPIEQEGTYPLPEAQLDRFMFSIQVDYPEYEEEVEIVRTTTSARSVQIDKVLSPEAIVRFQDLVLRVPVSDAVVRYAVRLVAATRPNSEHASDFVREFVSWGAGPRASQYLILGGKARALLHGRSQASMEDVRALAHSVLQHRIVPNFHAEAERIDSRRIVDEVLRLSRED